MVILAKLNLIIIFIIISWVGPTIGYSVHVINQLPNNDILIVHCKSKDDDLKARLIPVGSELGWKFGANDNTLFWCHLAVQDKRLKFDAYPPKNVPVFSPPYVFWNVRDSGVYRDDVLEFPWKF
ncbi:S-protein homolog 24 [Linum perenne]